MSSAIGAVTPFDNNMMESMAVVPGWLPIPIFTIWRKLSAHSASMC